jgi:hypothetical protein
MAALGRSLRDIFCYGNAVILAGAKNEFLTNP